MIKHKFTKAQKKKILDIAKKIDEIKDDEDKDTAIDKALAYFGTLSILLAAIKMRGK